MSAYGFRERLSAAFPSQIVIDATEVCNLACVHCPHPEFKKSEHYRARYLDIDLNRKMVDEVAADGKGIAQYIRYTSNGEPLVHPRIYDMLDDAVTRSGVFVTLTTNGTLLNERRVAKLFSSGLHMVDVSIDAHLPDTYSRIRVNGDLEVTRSNVLRLIRMRAELNSRTKIVVSFVEQPANMAEAGPFEQFWKAQGADAVVIRRLHSAAGGVVRVADMLRGQQRSQSRYPCLYPWERILLNPAGQLAFCPQDWLHGSAIADFRQATIKETWVGPIYGMLREAHLSNDFGRHPFCGGCPDWAQTRWPGEGRSYADLVAEFASSG